MPDRSKGDTVPERVPQIREKAARAAEAQRAPKSVRKTRTLIFQVYLVAAALGFAVLALFASTTDYFPIDLLITQAVQQHQEYGLPFLMNAVSWPGFSPQVIGVIAAFSLLLLVVGYVWEAVAVGVSAVATQVANTLVKVIIARPRPSSDIVSVFEQIQGYSFPSGHVMFYTAFYGFLAFLAFTNLKPSVLRTILVIAFTLMIVLVGPSRIYRGEHWASDVLGGYLLGSLALIASIQFYRWGKPRFLNYEEDR